MKNILILTVGLPQSGKSTWAKMSKCPIVNRDSIRLAIGGTIRYFKEENRVTELEQIMAISLFKAGHKEVIIDATHLKKKYRKSWVEFADRASLLLDDPVQVKLKRFKTPLSVCQKRARKNFPDEPHFQKVIYDMWKGADIDFLIRDEYTITGRILSILSIILLGR
jgi:predicted kinase